MLYQLSYSRRRSTRGLAAVFDLESRHRSADLENNPGGEGRIRTSEAVRRQIYSLFPLTTREPPQHDYPVALNRIAVVPPLLCRLVQPGAGERT